MNQVTIFDRDVTSAYSHNDRNSYEAHKSIKPEKSKIRAKVLNYIKSCPATSDEVEQALGLTHQTASARMTELKSLDLIVECGRRKTRSGRTASAWRVR